MKLQQVSWSCWGLLAAVSVVIGCGGDGSAASGSAATDTDGDGIADAEDPDIDGDGVANEDDADIDGDGVPNEQDTTPDGGPGDDTGSGGSGAAGAGSGGSGATGNGDGLPDDFEHGSDPMLPDECSNKPLSELFEYVDTDAMARPMPAIETSFIKEELVAAAPNGDTVVGYATTKDSAVHLAISRFDADGKRTRPDISRPITLESINPVEALWDLIALSDDHYALLVTRAMAVVFQIVSAKDFSLLKETILLEDPFKEPGKTNWEKGDKGFAQIPRTAELLRTEDGFAAYYTVNWKTGDPLPHQGDQLVLLDKDGDLDQKVFEWGCSHSLDVDLFERAAGNLVTACWQDLPGRLRHSQKGGKPGDTFYELADVSTSYRTERSFAGMVETDDALWFGFNELQESNKRERFVLFDLDGEKNDVVFATKPPGDDRHNHAKMAPFGGALLVGYEHTDKSRVPKASKFVRLSMETGQPLEGPVTIDEAKLYFSSRSFVTYPNGDVGWAWARSHETDSPNTKIFGNGDLQPIRLMRFTCQK